MRGIQDLTLDLKGLTVLIGDNGTGKSTILEAFELLRQAPLPVNYLSDVVSAKHNGLRSLLRHGKGSLTLSLRVEGDPEGPIDYRFSLSVGGYGPAVESESLTLHSDPSKPRPLAILIRDSARVRYFDRALGKIQDLPAEMGNDPQALMAFRFGIESQPAFTRLKRVLEAIEFHVPFETRPRWQLRDLNQGMLGARWPTVGERAQKLERFGTNLVNCFYHLREQGTTVWNKVVELARLGLGEDFRDFTIPLVERGTLELRLVFGSAPEHPISAENLSDGQLAYLCFVALSHLNANRSLLAFDEPELHLHPALLARATWMLETLAQSGPVVIATHSDRLLDALADPAQSVYLCHNHPTKGVQLARPDPERLAAWLEEYGGLGSIRSQGYQQQIFEESWA